MIWFRLFEAWAVVKLVQSPWFNRIIYGAHGKIHKVKHRVDRKMQGLPPLEDEGSRTGPTAFDHFRDEVRAQFKELTWQKKHPDATTREIEQYKERIRRH